ncbi:MAG: YeeE/YedE family protein [Pseudomonadales bacterium]
MNPRALAAAAAAAAYLAAHLWLTIGWRQAALFAVGLMAGVALYHAAFGFGGAWRSLLQERRSAGLRAQLVMLGVTVAVFLPLLAGGELLGTTLRGSAAPLGVSLVVGAFLFGVGMQVGGACASGTLFTVGGGSTRMLLTLAGFIAGSVLGARHIETWHSAPALPPVSLLQSYGPWMALAASLALLAGVWLVVSAMERRRHGTLEPTWRALGRSELLRGPWPLLLGALTLAAVNCATLALAGRPWGVTSAFALWGSKLVAATGIDVAGWSYWQSAARAESLRASVLADVTSVMNFGIVLGALLAASLAGRFAPVWRLPWRSLAAAVLGGVLLGYGARLAYGCNIGALFGGIASASLHGWVWFAAALLGNAAGMRLRPLFARAS